MPFRLGPIEIVVLIISAILVGLFVWAILDAHRNRSSAGVSFLREHQPDMILPAQLAHFERKTTRNILFLAAIITILLVLTGSMRLGFGILGGAFGVIIGLVLIRWFLSVLLDIFGLYDELSTLRADLDKTQAALEKTQADLQVTRQAQNLLIEKLKERYTERKAA